MIINVVAVRSACKCVNVDDGNMRARGAVSFLKHVVLSAYAAEDIRISDVTVQSSVSQP